MLAHSITCPTFDLLKRRKRIESQLKLKTMHITCEFPDYQYGTLILSGQYHEAEAECNVDAHAVLESVLTYGGEELLAYANGNQVGLPAGDFNEMEEYLLHNGEPGNRVKPSRKTLDIQQCC